MPWYICMAGPRGQTDERTEPVLLTCRSPRGPIRNICFPPGQPRRYVTWGGWLFVGRRIELQGSMHRESPSLTHIGHFRHAPPSPSRIAYPAPLKTWMSWPEKTAHQSAPPSGNWNKVGSACDTTAGSGEHDHMGKGRGWRERGRRFSARLSMTPAVDISGPILSVICQASLMTHESGRVSDCLAMQQYACLGACLECWTDHSRWFDQLMSICGPPRSAAEYNVGRSSSSDDSGIRHTLVPNSASL